MTESHEISCGIDQPSEIDQARMSISRLNPSIDGCSGEAPAAIIAEAPAAIIAEAPAAVIDLFAPG